MKWTTQTNGFDCGLFIALFPLYYLQDWKWEPLRSSTMREIIKNSLLQKKVIDHPGLPGKVSSTSPFALLTSSSPLPQTSPPMVASSQDPPIPAPQSLTPIIPAPQSLTPIIPAVQSSTSIPVSQSSTSPVSSSPPPEHLISTTSKGKRKAEEIEEKPKEPRAVSPRKVFRAEPGNSEEDAIWKQISAKLEEGSEPKTQEEVISRLKMICSTRWRAYANQVRDCWILPLFQESGKAGEPSKRNNILKKVGVEKLANLVTLLGGSVANKPSLVNLLDEVDKMLKKKKK